MKIHIVEKSAKNSIAICGTFAVLYSDSLQNLYKDFPRSPTSKHCQNCLKKAGSSTIRLNKPIVFNIVEQPILRDWNAAMKEVERISSLPKIVFTNDKGILLDEFRIHDKGTWWVFYVNGEKKIICNEINADNLTLFDTVKKSVTELNELEFQFKAFKKPYLNKKKH
jgi:hypothetical protein